MHKVNYDFKYGLDKVLSNVDECGVVRCLECKYGTISYGTRSIRAAFKYYSNPEPVDIETYQCDHCDFYHISQEHVDNLRKTL